MEQNFVGGLITNQTAGGLITNQTGSGYTRGEISVTKTNAPIPHDSLTEKTYHYI